MSKKVYFITGGGTGGHIYPAIAVADALANNPDNDIYYVGNPDNLEYGIAQQKGYKFLPVHVKGMPRKLSLSFVFWGIQLVFAILKSYMYLKKYKPNAIFGTGGYVSAPVLIASVIHGKIPYMLHDCDMQPGIVTRKLAPKAKCVSLAFEGAKKFINNRNCFINGNPLRPEIKQITKEMARVHLGIESDRPVLCVTGGSQGSKSIDNAFVEIIKELSQKYKFHIIFQTGRKNYLPVIERLSKIYRDYDKDKNVMVRPYFDDMITVLRASDIVISRAGSLSLSEIFASGAAPILIPYPFAAADHQRKNAHYVQEHDACIYLEDEDTDPNSLLNILVDLKNNPDKVENLQKKSYGLAKFDALNDIIEQLERVSEYYG
ncbi:MAG: undecaprenyldiphospho-muramoylpentapeptide beta-N-acetylglucosaminyltransferase [Candidatus Gastranaerophilales bacterium]|nr:undecaprenyldiphospho-muramoylpentapeptide beta-N-acetylglucosaminyltransferase [Candidatus Gastranaerophilales bacterium]